MKVVKSGIRIFVALFAAFFGTLQLSMSGCSIAPGATWFRWACHDHPIVAPILLFGVLLSLTLFVLSHRCTGWRVPIAVVILLGYGIYGITDAIGYRLWWFGLVPAVALAAAVGVGMRARWGTLLTYAISALFVLSWSWEVVTNVRDGYFSSRPPLEGALSFVPGLAFLLCAVFCCYASANGGSPRTKHA